VTEGCVVCIQCGMIQSGSITEDAFTGAVVCHNGVSPYVVHRYSRWVYMKSILQSAQGLTAVEVDPLHRTQIQEFCKQKDSLDATGVKMAIRILKLPYRLMRHAVTIACELWPDLHKHTVVISDREMHALCRSFRGYENAWDRSGSDVCRANRRAFLNYRQLFREMCKDLGYTHLLDVFRPMRTKKLVGRQNVLISAIKLKVYA